MNEKRPRAYAAEILDIKTREGRAEYLDSQVPEHLKDWVKLYVEQSFALSKQKRR